MSKKKRAERLWRRMWASGRAGVACTCDKCYDVVAGVRTMVAPHELIEHVCFKDEPPAGCRLDQGM